MRPAAFGKLALLDVMACFAASLPGAAPGAEESQSAAPRPPELKVLDRLIGTWDTERIMKPAAWTPKEVRTTAKFTREWVLGGRFVQAKQSISDGSELIVMHTFDVQKKAYRYWVFGSDGNASETSGQWDPAAETFSWRTDLADGMTITLSLHLIDADTQEWTLVVKDAGGQVCLRLPDLAAFAMRPKCSGG